jgi:hypothetical protein
VSRSAVADLLSALAHFLFICSSQESRLYGNDVLAAKAALADIRHAAAVLRTLSQAPATAATDNDDAPTAEDAGAGEMLLERHMGAAEALPAVPHQHGCDVAAEDGVAARTHGEIVGSACGDDDSRADTDSSFVYAGYDALSLAPQAKVDASDDEADHGDEVSVYDGYGYYSLDVKPTAASLLRTTVAADAPTDGGDTPRPPIASLGKGCGASCRLPCFSSGIA